MSGICVNKVLIDGGATISLFPERMLIKVGKHFDDLIPTNISVTDYTGVYNDKLKPLDVDRMLNYYNSKGCFLTSEGLSVKLRHPFRLCMYFKFLGVMLLTSLASMYLEILAL
ncbi:hypothetical protein Ahy_B01g053947 [Arachis hypogaea]|uniref:Uncharacterized protein n=1 Tax=Arachis hypogaea TaxID=3818 RepID=A0A445ASZ2_ARAHY|nr:hypothetical protein Ahy_B01g053947 [Arachis hypogaea]